MVFSANAMNVIVLSSPEQHVAFSIEVDQTKFFIATIYESNFHVIQKQL